MKNNKIWMPEQLTEYDKTVLSDAIEKLREKMTREETPAERDERLSRNPNYIKKDGKWYDKRYMK